MARNEQLIRQHRILQILEASRFGRLLAEIRDDLVDELGLGKLHTRTVRRDLEALQAAGIDVDVHDSPRGRVWKLGPRFRGVTKIAATATELIALSIGRDLLAPLAGTPFMSGIESFWTKMRETLPPTVWEHYEKERSLLRVHGRPIKSYEKQQGILRTINRAITQHRVVRANYRSLNARSPRPREIEPYGIIVYDASIYIVARGHDTQAESANPSGDDMRHFKLDRFFSAEATDTYFSPQKDFDLEDHLASSVGVFSGGAGVAYRIRVSEFATPFVLEDPWRADQTVEPCKGGGVILTVTAAHDLEIIPRVLALGAEAELLEPTSARERIAEIAQRIAACYKSV